jgi:aryl-alcohol dehydrogenase-like predicted oxidoreductase
MLPNRHQPESRPVPMNEFEAAMEALCDVWVLRQSNVASAIVGASRPAQLDDNAAASGLVIDPALFAKAEAIVAAIPMAP